MRVAVVTGASSGIGAALCRALRPDGWHVVGLSRSDGARRRRARDLRRRRPRGGRGGRRAGARAASPDRPARQQRRDRRTGGLPRRATPETIETLIRTNYLGSVWCLRAFLPGLGRGLARRQRRLGRRASSRSVPTRRRSTLSSRSPGRSPSSSPRAASRCTRSIPGFVETPGFPQRHRFNYGSYRLRRAARADRRPRSSSDRARPAGDRGAPLVRPVAWLQALVPGAFARGRARDRGLR